MTSRASGNLSGWHTGWCWNLCFSTRLYCTLVAPCICCCSWFSRCALLCTRCSTLGCCQVSSVAAGACNMYGFCGTCTWDSASFVGDIRGVCHLGRLRSGFITTYPRGVSIFWWYTAHTVVYTRYDLCHSQCTTVHEIQYRYYLSTKQW